MTLARPVGPGTAVAEGPGCQVRSGTAVVGHPAVLGHWSGGLWGRFGTKKAEEGFPRSECPAGNIWIDM